MRRAVFLDRDGTLNVKPPPHDYVNRLEDFRWLPGAVDGVAMLAQAGYVLAVVSNQRGVARGITDMATLGAIEGKIQHDLAERGAAISHFGYCVHGSDVGCACRKPKPGLLLDAARRLEVSLAESWVVGDAATDVEAGRAAGCKTVLITPDGHRGDADLAASSLLEAARAIVAADRTAR